MAFALGPIALALSSKVQGLVLGLGTALTTFLLSPSNS